MMLRVVLDTNIFISGIFWDGNYCSQIIKAWQEGKIVLVSSLEMITELVDTIRDFKIEMPEKMIQEWRNVVIENAVIVVPAKKLDLVKNDPDDNKFFEAALAGKAKYIVSQDKKHVLSIPNFKGIKTIHPEEFVKLR
jgi:uncharacterized protein